MAIDFDTSELRTLAADLGKAGTAVAREIKPVMSKGALAIKTQMRSEMFASPHFKGVGSSITYDITESASGVMAEIGPKKGAGSPGNLANIAYFGTSRGGGTVPDPQGALDAEAPRFEAALVKILGDIL